MCWYALLPLLFVFLLAAPTSSSDQAGDLGQATLTMHANVSDHAHFTDNQGCTTDDEVSVTVTERIQYRIAAIPNGALDLEMMSHQNSFTASGGRTHTGKNCEGSWAYHTKDHTGDRVAGVWVNLGTGRGGFMIASSFIKDAELKTTMVVAGNTIQGAPPGSPEWRLREWWTSRSWRLARRQRTS